jgi:hypothetical protein
MTVDQPEVMLESTATPYEVAAVGNAFLVAGLDAKVSANYERRGADIYPWALFVLVPVGAFFKKIGEAAGEDAWKALKGLVRRLYEARRESPAPKGVVVLQSRGEFEEDIVLEDDLPDEAWEALIRIERRRTSSGYMRWDPSKGKWRDPSEDR